MNKAQKIIKNIGKKQITKSKQFDFPSKAEL